MGLTEQTFERCPHGLRTILGCDADTIVLTGEAAAQFLAAMGATEPLQPHERILGRKESAYQTVPFPSVLRTEGSALRRVWVREYCPPLP